MNAKHDLAEALCQLLETKTLEKITVKDIVARCGVNRQTFYYHFHDVYDLMRWIFDREAAALAQSIRSNGSDWRQELRTITDVLRSKRHLVMNAYRSVNRRDLERYLMQGYGPVIRRIVDQAAVDLDVTQGDLEFVSRFYARGLLSGVFDWIESGMPESIGDDLRRCILLLDGSLPTASARNKRKASGFGRRLCFSCQIPENTPRRPLSSHSAFAIIKYYLQYRERGVPS